MFIIRFLLKLVVCLLPEVLEKCSCDDDDDDNNEYSAKSFEWHDDDPFFDSLVGIEVDGKPCCAGVFVYSDVIVASANPYPRDIYKKSQTRRADNVKMYAIDGDPKKARLLSFNMTTGNQYNRNRRNWLKVGFDDRHTTIHDLVFTTVNNDPASYLPENRQPSYAFFEGVNTKPYPFTGWKIAGFGFKSRDHVKNSYKLVVIDHGNDEEVLADCDEWIPRPWGHFICLNNVENLSGIQSGAGLFNGMYLYGIGAFEVTKGNESILVFTDLSEYILAGFPLYVAIIH